MNKEEFEAKITNLDEKMKGITKDTIDTAVIKGMYAKDKIDEMIGETKSNVNVLKENYRIFSEKAKGKLSSELIKTQMNMDVAKEELEAKKEAYDKTKFEEYIEGMAEYASAWAELSALAAEEAKLATLETIASQKEYEEKYGENYNETYSGDNSETYEGNSNENYSNNYEDSNSDNYEDNEE